MANPVLNDKFFNNNDNKDMALDGKTMTVNGTIQITLFLGILLVLAAAFTWSRFALGYNDYAMALTYGGLFVGLVLGFIIIFTKNKVLIPIYAICEGLCLGGVSALAESYYHGVVVNAVFGTFAAIFSMLVLYRTRVIQCTDKFRSVVFISTLSILGVYLINFVGNWFGYAVPVINDSTIAGIIVSGVIIVIAALNLIVDFDFIERGERQMLSKDYEWYGAFGLMVTIVWLYLEILKLLAKMSSRR